MMKTGNMNLLRLTVLVAALALVSAAALAQGPGAGRGEGPGFGPGHGHGQGWMMDRDEGGMPPMMADRLGLSEDQQTAIAKIHDQMRQDNLELRKQLLRLRNELQGELLQDDPDQGKVVSLTEQIGKLRTEMQTNRIKTRLAVRKQLTPEQRDMMLMMGPAHGMDKGPGRRGGARGRCGARGFGDQGRRPGCDGSGPGRAFGDRDDG